jgi:hypothetical protein
MTSLASNTDNSRAVSLLGNFLAMSYAVWESKKPYCDVIEGDTTDPEATLTISDSFVALLNSAMDELDDPNEHFVYNTVEEFLASLDDDVD